MVLSSTFILVIVIIINGVLGTLETLHIIFRHGNKNPDIPYMYKNDPYKNETFPPYGQGQLTNAGRKRMYHLGEELRNIYDGFIGDYYIDDELDAWSSEFTRTQTSLQAVLAGLYPPRGYQIFEEDLHWQPIPYKLLPLKDDKLFLGMWKYIFNNAEVFNTEALRKTLKKYKDLREYMKKYGGTPADELRDVIMYFTALSAEKSVGLKLPEWAEKRYDEIMKFGVECLGLITESKELKRIVVGDLLKKILKDTKRKLKKEINTKLHVYSAHDINIEGVLMTLKLSKEPQFIDYGACIVVEVHKIGESNTLHFLYKKDDKTDFETLKVMSLKEYQAIVYDIYDEDHGYINSSSNSKYSRYNFLFAVLFIMKLMH